MASPSKVPAGLVLTLALVQVALGFLIARAYVDSHNTLYNNARWTPSKTKLMGGIIGAQSYLFGKQTLARDRLNLNAWFGYQEVVSKEEFDPRSIEFDFGLAKGAYLAFGFGRGDGPYPALVLSASKRYPAAFVIATEEGEFLRKRKLRRLGAGLPGGVHRLRVDFDTETDRHFTVSLDGQELKTLQAPLARPMRLSFRGARRMGFVDSVTLIERDGGTFVEDFSRPAHWRLAYVVSIGGILLGSLVVFLILRRIVSISDKYLLFYFLMFSFVLIAGAILYSALVWRQAKFYPNRSAMLERREQSYADAGTERMVARIESNYEPQPEPGIERILFIGSSQTRGSGAAHEDHTLARQTELLLNQRAGERRFECLNVGVRAYRMKQMRVDFEERWVDWNIALAIVNAGYNDRDTRTAPFAEDLWGLIAAAREAGIQLVFIPEASEPPTLTKNMHRIHNSMRSIATRAQIPVLEMYPHLQTRIADGFLWWDWVHLTSYGQRLFAEHLTDELERLELVNLEISNP